jgi:hypothetical protein
VPDTFFWLLLPRCHTLEAVPSRGTVHLGAVLLRFDWGSVLESARPRLLWLRCRSARRAHQPHIRIKALRCRSRGPWRILAPEDLWFQVVSKRLGQSHGWSPKGDSSTFVAHDMGASLTPIRKRAAVSPFSHVVVNQHLNWLTPPLWVSQTRDPACRRSHPS